MCYTPQRSKGNLILSTEDGQQVPALGERHLGKHAGIASTIETEFDGSHVEKSGTGLRAEVKNGRRPPTGLLACAALWGV